MRHGSAPSAGRHQGAGRLAALTGLGALTGLASGLGLAALDGVLDVTLPVVVEHAQLLLGTLVGATVTVVVFALWMRTVVVGLLSDQVSPRIVTTYLDDGYQRWLVAVGVGVIAFLAVGVLTLPDPEVADGVPALTTSVGTLAALFATAGVLWSVQVAVRDLSLPHVIRQVADDALRVLDIHEDADHPRPDHTVGEDAERLTAQSMGWVTHVDRAGLLASVPDGATVSLDADVGDFVAAHQIVARCDQQLDDDQRDAVVDAIELGRTRSPEHDLAFAIQPLIDIAEHAMGATSNDTSTAHEALVHLRAVLREILLRGPVTGWWTDGEGRWVRTSRVRHPVDHIDAALERLTAVAATAPMRADVRSLITHLRPTADQLGADEVVARLDDHARVLDERVGSPGHG